MSPVTAARPARRQDLKSRPPANETEGTEIARTRREPGGHPGGTVTRAIKTLKSQALWLTLGYLGLILLLARAYA